MSTPSSNFFFFLFIILLVFFTFSYAAYLPQQGFLEATLNKNQHQDAVEPKQIEAEESCKGPKERECLERRTLAAHL
ncbi:phytosulfokine-like [Capsicum galapagoense]